MQVSAHLAMANQGRNPLKTSGPVCLQPAGLPSFTAGMTLTEQELACIHADALLVQQCLQLSAGLQEVTAGTAAKKQRLIASTVKRDKQSAIFGTRTMKEKRMDEAAIEAAGKTPSSAAVGTCFEHVPHKDLGWLTLVLAVGNMYITRVLAFTQTQISGSIMVYT